MHGSLINEMMNNKEFINNPYLIAGGIVVNAKNKSLVEIILIGCFLAFSHQSDAGEPMAPRGVLKPFDKKSLESFSTWLKNMGSQDPQNVFRLEHGVLRCGDEDMGYIATKNPYKDYHLQIEYKWGRKNLKDKNVRNSGVLLHGSGPDGSQNGLWKTSIECQLAQGCEGDLILIKGKKNDGTIFPGSISSKTITAEDGKTRWHPEGKSTPYSGKQFWWSKHQAFFKELIDTRGKDDIASPLGEWTKVECICKGTGIIIKINGIVVNECFDANPSGGQILLQSEGHEVFFRNMEIRPLGYEPVDTRTK